MKPHLLLTAGVLFIMSCSSGSYVDDMEETPYYPLLVGNTWTYTGGQDKDKVTIVNRVAAHERVGGVMCAKIESAQGSVIGTEYISVTKDGIYRVKLNDYEAAK